MQSLTKLWTRNFALILDTNYYFIEIFSKRQKYWKILNVGKPRVVIAFFNALGLSFNLWASFFLILMFVVYKRNIYNFSDVNEGTWRHERLLSR